MFIDDEEVIKSVQRVFEIFEWFDQQRKPASATTVARALGYPVSSTNSLVKSMAERGYLTFDPIARDYFPTLQLAQKAAWMDRGCYGPGGLRSLVRELQDATGETVTLSCQNDLQMVFVEVASPVRRVEPPTASVGGPAPLFRSAVGFSALSCRSDREVSGLLSRYNRRTYRSSAKADPGNVLEKVRRARTYGHSIGYGLFVENTGAIAWALPRKGTGHPAVIAVGGPSERIRTNERAILGAGRTAIDRFLAL
ncbi:IclR family transcriptional regulator [Novosphingobium sp. BL-52-GroH]|uniref:IclR family transcriptional regulator n=1 Tax=Novosphingobium sp. BL-52-GroH TaxID=3349877 RepID=UPI00384FA3A6